MEQDTRRRPTERPKASVTRERPASPASRPRSSRPPTGNAASREAERQARRTREAAAQQEAQTATRQRRSVAQNAARREPTRDGAAQERRVRADAAQRTAASSADRSRQQKRPSAEPQSRRNQQQRSAQQAQDEAQRQAEQRAKKRALEQKRALAKQRELEAKQKQEAEREQEKKRAREARAKAQAAKKEASAAKRKQKRPHRVYNTNFGFKFITMLAVVAVIVISMAIFFKVKHISIVFSGKAVQTPVGVSVDVQSTELPTTAPTDAPQQGAADAGNAHSYYTAEEVIAASGIHLDDNLLSLSKATVASRIHAALPYVNQIQIKKQLPGTVIITISEFEITYGIQDETGAWWLMSREGRILEPANEQTIRDHLLIKGMPIQVPQVGDWFKPAATEGADMSEIASKQKVVLELIPELEEAPFFKEIVSIDVSTSYNLTLWYGTRYEIRLGTVEKLDYKFRFLEATLADKEIQRRSGTIDLTFNEDNKAHFMEFR